MNTLFSNISIHLRFLKFRSIFAGQNILGVSYPFELIKNKTLEFFSKTLPILKADETLPKVTQPRFDLKPAKVISLKKRNQN